tara:strand:- start:700 stop:909 length:210 start_codon:yes stop_codon:yes gene_type:complete
MSKSKPKAKANPLPKNVRKAMDNVSKDNTDARNILKDLYDTEMKRQKKKNKFFTGGSVHASFGTEFDDR